MKDKEIVRIGYNQIASKYLEERTKNLPEMELLKEFVSYFPEKTKFLDAGCGAGVPFTEYLSEKFEVVGIDISETQIALAKKNVSKATFFCQDITTIDFPDDFFDGIISYYVIIHIPREEHNVLFKKFFNILKTGGRALICLSEKEDKGSYEDDFFGSKMFWSSFDIATYKKMICKIGFTIEKITYISDSLGDSKHPFFQLLK